MERLYVRRYDFNNVINNGQVIIEELQYVQ